MYASRLYIENYRSIKKVDIELSANKNVIIGKNNSGKSNIMSALNLMLGERNPSYAYYDNITDDDFFTYKKQSSNTIFIWLELDRTANPKEDFDYALMYVGSGYKIYTQETNYTMPKRIPKESDPGKYKSIFDINPDGDSTKTHWVDAKDKSKKQLEGQLENMFKFAFAFLATKDEKGKINKEMRLLYRENENQDWVLAFRDTIRTELLLSATIPAFRDPSTELRLNNWSWFGKLMKSLTDKHLANADLIKALESVNQASQIMFTDIQKNIEQSSIEVAFSGTKLSFQFSGDANKELFKSIKIYVDDGFKSELSRKGTGLQSVVVIGLFSYFVNVVSAKAGALLCVEEPELFLHPHAKRVVSDRLDDFVDAKEKFKNQVVLTTHSTEFIRSITGKIQLIRISKKDDETHIFPLSRKDSQKFIINPEQAELVFADKVIICEGDDKALIDCIADKNYPQNLDTNNVSVIKVKGKNNIIRTIKFALALGIRPVVLCDFDFFLRDKAEDRNKYKAKAHDSVEQLLDIGETLGDESLKIHKSATKLRSKIKKDHEKLFYKAKSLDEFNDEELKKSIQAVLNKYKSLGIHILSTDLEGLFKDKSFLNDRKCDDDTVNKLRYLDKDSIEEVLDTKPLLECINATT